MHAYLLANVRSFSRSEAYRRLPQEQVFAALSSDRLQVDDEKQVYEAALLYHFTPEQVEAEQEELQAELQVGTTTVISGSGWGHLELTPPPPPSPRTTCRCCTPSASA